MCVLVANDNCLGGPHPESASLFDIDGYFTWVKEPFKWGYTEIQLDRRVCLKKYAQIGDLNN